MTIIRGTIAGLPAHPIAVDTAILDAGSIYLREASAWSGAYTQSGVGDGIYLLTETFTATESAPGTLQLATDTGRVYNRVHGGLSPHTWRLFGSAGSPGMVSTATIDAFSDPADSIVGGLRVYESTTGSVWQWGGSSFARVTEGRSAADLLARGVTGAQLYSLLGTSVTVHEGLGHISVDGDDIVITLEPGDRCVWSFDVTPYYAAEAWTHAIAMDAESAVGTSDDWIWGCGLVTYDGVLDLAATPLMTRGIAPTGVKKAAGGAHRIDTVTTTRVRITEIDDTPVGANDAGRVQNWAWGAHIAGAQVKVNAGSTDSANATSWVTEDTLRGFFEAVNRAGSSVPVLTIRLSRWTLGAS